MRGLKLTGCILLCVCVVVLNSPQSAQAALFTRDAEAAIVATNAEAAEIAYVTPQSNAGTTLFSTGTGFTSIGNDLLGRLQQMFQLSAVEQAAAPAAIDQQVTEDQSGIAVIPLETEKAAVVGTPVVLMGEEKAALTIEEMIPVVPAEEIIVQEPVQPAEAVATQEDEDKALFPLLWSGRGTTGAGALVGGGLFATSGAKAIGIGILVVAVALGIILPLAFSGSGGGGGGGGSGQGDGGVRIPGTGGGAGAGDGSGSGDGDGTGDQDPSTPGSSPIPEPLTLILFGAGLIGLFLRKRNA
ncbi:PEP-CTERM sorting domain-containing protein [Candidatus Omnitrophota bacterium]